MTLVLEAGHLQMVGVRYENSVDVYHPSAIPQLAQGCSSCLMDSVLVGVV